MTINNPLVYALVITYNGRQYLPGSLGTLRRTRHDNLRLLLVDNGSSDGCGEWVREHFPAVEVLTLSPNVGYVRAANVGIQYAMERGADYVVPCNDDIEVLDDRWLDAALDVMEARPEVGIAGYEESPDRDSPLPSTVSFASTDHLIGFAMVLRSAMLQPLGLFDPAYGVFASEDDLIIRAQRAGFRTVRFNIPFLHLGGGTVVRCRPETGYLQMCSGLRFCLKHRGPARIAARVLRYLDVACNPCPLTFHPADNAHRRIRNRGNVLMNARLLLRAIGWNIWHLPQTMRARLQDGKMVRVARAALRREQSASCAPAASVATLGAPSLIAQSLQADANADVMSLEQ